MLPVARDLRRADWVRPLKTSESSEDLRIKHLMRARFDFRRDQPAHLSGSLRLEPLVTRRPDGDRRQASQASQIQTIQLFDDVLDLVGDELDEIAQLRPA